MINRYVADVIAASALLAALIYIGRKVGAVATILQLLARLPDEHAQLLEATRVNTANIAQLTAQVQQLTADVSRIAHQ